MHAFNILCVYTHTCVCFCDPEVCYFVRIDAIYCSMLINQYSIAPHSLTVEGTRVRATRGLKMFSIYVFIAVIFIHILNGIHETRAE